MSVTCVLKPNVDCATSVTRRVNPDRPFATSVTPLLNLDVLCATSMTPPLNSNARFHDVDDICSQLGRPLRDISDTSSDPSQHDADDIRLNPDCNNSTFTKGQMDRRTDRRKDRHNRLLFYI
ncbi:unnamed protein product [Heligmosomoides polygyrus]|uniref:Uncharacterized protein n=1 Tax=Heligmosomoides polygyrus TaxID=6339 RepID=A0A183FHV6_HELPZ|nr:unnamed protein product [Heligmosomoides polygyrus]